MVSGASRWSLETSARDDKPASTIMRSVPTQATAYPPVVFAAADRLQRSIPFMIDLVPVSPRLVAEHGGVGKPVPLWMNHR